MLYIFLSKNLIKLLHLKKSILGNYETFFYTKEVQVDLLTKGQPTNVDVIASGVKEVLDAIPTTPLKERDVTLVLPQDTFSFFRSDMPVDITDSVLESYLLEKARTKLNSDVDNSKFSYIIRESEGMKKIMYYMIHQDQINRYREPLDLLELNLVSVIPEPLTYFKLFEKTLRENKNENIWYVSYDKDKLSGYVYDSFGLLEENRWENPLKESDDVEKVLNKQASAYGNTNIKLNRLILSGTLSDEVRQDTFTKNVGVWTNPLKRIIPHFYGSYLKMLSGDRKDKDSVPVLEYDMLIGGFIFQQENKEFKLIDETKTSRKLPSVPAISPKKIPKKGIAFFLASFLATFLILFGITRVNWGNMNFAMPKLNVSLPRFGQEPSPTPRPTVVPTRAPTATPTPAIDREEVRIMVLNGSGITGKASDVKTFLAEQGYTDILTGNADAFDYETTVVKIKEDQEDLQKLIAEDIASQVESPEFELLDETDAADIVIIVGTDFK